MGVGLLCEFLLVHKCGLTQPKVSKVQLRTWATFVKREKDNVRRNAYKPIEPILVPVAVFLVRSMYIAAMKKFLLSQTIQNNAIYPRIDQFKQDDI